MRNRAPKLSAEDIRVMQERRRSSATRFVRKTSRKTERRQAIREAAS